MKAPAPRILVIDDNAAMVEILVTCLGEEGYGVSGALTSDEGLKLFILSLSFAKTSSNSMDDGRCSPTG